MADETRLDAAHAAMQAAPGDDRARLAFFGALAASELILLLDAERDGDNVTPRTVEADGQSFVLAFDREDRLACFAGGTAPYAALSGRVLAGMLAGQRLGLALNLGTAPSETLLPADAMAWLAQTLAGGPEEAEARLRVVRPPGDLPPHLLTALDTRLAGAAGLAASAFLVWVVYDTGTERHMLAIVDAAPGAKGALARAVSDALRFSGLEDGALDVAFFRADDAIVARLARVGLRFDLPQPERPAHLPGTAPGMDPDHPPRLK